jgi:2-polyprenyl-6-methoxyphenol hydroxylase-like FAD-dependent oxidoreductase
VNKATCRDQTCDASLTADVLIVGSGISGTLAAAVLGRAGYTVCLIDRHAVYPPDFRAEHLDGPQVEQLHRLGFLDSLTLDLYRGKTVTLARFGRVVASAETLNFGIRYEALVNRARAGLPPAVTMITGRVNEIITSDAEQRIRMADGRVFAGRLVILATGQGYALCRQSGIKRRVLREAHSLTFGFHIEPVGGAPFEHSFVVYQREEIRDRIDYLSAFTMDGATRVNLFTYSGYRDPWTRKLLTEPDSCLDRTLPGLTSVIGQYRTVGPVVARPVDLYVSEDFRRDGVVLIGDAFQASCPATGMGMVKLLTDIEQLTTLHVPRWLRTPGMGAAKLSSFYDDPVKQACDTKTLHDAEYRRSVSTETTLKWRLHRTRVHVLERLQGWQNRMLTPLHPRMDSAASKPSFVPG